ncbi:LytR/AlgR family response regulator transcription factor [Roseateles amylovorans]|uniref:LytTR family DNA-binding domain-containing protein n=1 Tax=Roseateles amylovorans TaxID=2978473 RepID=A0ABY6B6C7_9BURK|nr:LytTR family DNA-binding domain-containing protein [Roseateles amylovorans]UXH79883.1 LytTR family DNA-binding domain-containing protein [Roseateles amylovorans]
MPTALIAEDEELLAAHLRQELTTLWPALQISAMASHGQEAVDLALKHQPDICFFDIRMPGLTGLEAAAVLADEWPQNKPFPLLVFVTAYDQYALQAFERAAVDYVLKPVQRERLSQTVGRLQTALSQRQPAPQALDAALAQLRGLLASAGGADRATALANEPSGAVGANAGSATSASGPLLRHLQVGVGDSIVMLPVDQIVYLEAADKYVRVLTAEQEYLVRISLRELLPQLDTARFWQVHRGHIVQVDAIDRVVRDESGRLTLKFRQRPEKLAVSRMYAHLFKAL